MVATTLTEALSRGVYPDEGGYTNDPRDPGGPTQYGITIHDYRLYINPHGTANDVKNMSKSTADMIYRTKYAKPICYDQLPAGIDYSTFDAAINSGIGRAPKWLAAALGVQVAPMVALALKAQAAPDKPKVINAQWKVRMSFLRGLGTFSHFGKGWTRRVVHGNALALQLWHKYGENAAPIVVKQKMDDHAAVAKKQGQNKVIQGSGTAGAGGVAGTGSTTDPAAVAGWSYWDHPYLYAGLGVALLLVLAWCIWWAYIHFARAKAMEQVGTAAVQPPPTSVAQEVHQLEQTGVLQPAKGVFGSLRSGWNSFWDWINDHFFPWLDGWRTTIFGWAAIAVATADQFGLIDILQQWGVNPKTVQILSLCFLFLRFVTARDEAKKDA